MSERDVFWGMTSFTSDWKGHSGAFSADKNQVPRRIQSDNSV